MRTLAWCPARARTSLILGWMSWCLSIGRPSRAEVLPEGFDRLPRGGVAVGVGEGLRGSEALVADLGQCDGDRPEVEMALARGPAIRVDEVHVTHEAGRVPKGGG